MDGPTSFTSTAEKFNNYFLSIPTKTIATITPCNVAPTTYLTQLNIPSLQLYHASEHDVLELIKNLNTKKSTGADKIPPHFIKLFGLFIAKPITVIINKSIDLCVVPSVWKSANITHTKKER